MEKIFTLVLLFLFLVKPVQAIVDPRLTSNNRFGIHILNQSDLEAAANLVNSHGGQWGYVTLVLTQDDLNHNKWQTIFDQCRQLKLIPIIRLATTPINDYWSIPDLNQLDNLLNFLNNLNWVIQNRYIILFNEPNHAKEWGNTLNPSEYAKIATAFSQAFKKASPDYFILPAGLDTAAPNSKDTMTAIDYWSKMHQTDPEIFKIFDGWNSHSYPNPGFSGPVTGVGFGTLQSYQAEINYLKKYELPNNLPIFITETGWIHRDGKVLGSSTENLGLSNFYTYAFKSVWTQPNLIAVTPFVLNYPSDPFSQFAWQKPDSQDFYPHYYAVQALDKTAGQPTQINDSQLIKNNLPNQLIEASSYQFELTFKNTGQSIWDQTTTDLKITSNLPSNSLRITPFEITKPGDQITLTLTTLTPVSIKPITLQAQLVFLQKPFGAVIKKNIEVIPPPSVIIKADRLLKNNLKPVDYRLLIYDQDQTLRKELTIVLKQGISDSIKLFNLIPQKYYRFVLLKPGYLPRQINTLLSPTHILIQFKTLLPLDPNQDGRLSFKDLFFVLVKLFGIK